MSSFRGLWGGGRICVRIRRGAGGAMGCTQVSFGQLLDVKVACVDDYDGWRNVFWLLKGFQVTDRIDLIALWLQDFYLACLMFVDDACLICFLMTCQASARWWRCDMMTRRLWECFEITWWKGLLYRCGVSRKWHLDSELFSSALETGLSNPWKESLVMRHKLGCVIGIP